MRWSAKAAVAGAGVGIALLVAAASGVVVFSADEATRVVVTHHTTGNRPLAAYVQTDGSTL